MFIPRVSQIHICRLERPEEATEELLSIWSPPLHSCKLTKRLQVRGNARLLACWARSTALILRARREDCLRLVRRQQRGWLIVEMFWQKKTYVGRCIFSSMVRWPFLPSIVPPPPRYPGEGTPQCKIFGTFVWDNYLLKIKSTLRGVRTNYFQWCCHEIFSLQGTSALANKISWIGLKYVGCTGNNQQLIDGAKKRSSCLTIQQLFLFLVTDYLNNVLK